MKRIEYEAIVFHTINKGEMKSLLKEYNGKLNNELIDFEKSYNVYNLSNGAIIYEMVALKIFLFNSLADFQYFKRKTAETARNSVRQKFEIKNENFINDIEFYIKLFEKQFNLNIDFKSIESLKGLDKLFRIVAIEEIIPKYSYSLIAVIGELLRLNIEGLKWISLKIYDDVPSRYMLRINNNLHDPSAILEKIIYIKSDFKKNIIFYKTINDIINYANRELY